MRTVFIRLVTSARKPRHDRHFRAAARRASTPHPIRHPTHSCHQCRTAHHTPDTALADAGTTLIVTATVGLIVTVRTAIAVIAVVIAVVIARIGSARRPVDHTRPARGMRCSICCLP
ncbi:hypothetical protein [Nocardia sp.]|uniref:hypothetical protein n=1 Tax=Nocardia sp. TaxID=1821 RepID=UPI002615BD9E|nr:hypothetical protein [Nocardia sp.]